MQSLEKTSTISRMRKKNYIVKQLFDEMFIFGVCFISSTASGDGR